MDSAGLDPLAYRDLDAAFACDARRDGDLVPLTRLVREGGMRTTRWCGHVRAERYSQGLFVAASCADNPQAYDMRLEPGVARAALAGRRSRRKQAENPRSLRSRSPIDEFLGNTARLLRICRSACRGRSPRSCILPGRTGSAGYALSRTCPGSRAGPAISTRLRRRRKATRPLRSLRGRRHVIVANTGHVSALDDYKGVPSRSCSAFTRVGTNRRSAVRLARSRASSRSVVRTNARRRDSRLYRLPATRAPSADLRAAAAVDAARAWADVLARVLRVHAGIRDGIARRYVHRSDPG